MMKSRIIEFKSIADKRGILTAIEGEQDIPFEIKRVFYMHHVVADRGGHAHIDTDQVLIPLHGSLRVVLFNGKEKNEYIMDDCTKGLYIPRLYFTDMYDFAPDTVCLLLSSTHYDIGKSLRSMEEYITYLTNKKLI